MRRLPLRLERLRRLWWLRRLRMVLVERRLPRLLDSTTFLLHQ